MINTFYLLVVFFILTNCNTPYKTKVGTCCNNTYTKIDDAIKCLSLTTDGNGTTSDERLLLIAFVCKDINANQKLGWNIIKDPDIITEAKEKYTLIILDVNQYKIPNNDCSSYMAESLKKNNGKTFFVIANQGQCWLGDWTLDENKDNIIANLGVGSGP